MNDDLISKNTLLKELKDFRMTITGSANAMALTVMDKTKTSIMRIIEEQPSAYDVDKVINMLKERAEHAESKAAEYDEKGDIPMMDIWDAEAKSYRNAIEIIKSGGVVNS